MSRMIVVWVLSVGLSFCLYIYLTQTEQTMVKIQ